MSSYRPPWPLAASMCCPSRYMSMLDEPEMVVVVRHTKCHCSPFSASVTGRDWAELVLPFAWRKSTYWPADPGIALNPTSIILWLIRIWSMGDLTGSRAPYVAGANQTQSVCSPLLVIPTSSVMLETSATQIGAVDRRASLHPQLMPSTIAL